MRTVKHRLAPRSNPSSPSRKHVDNLKDSAAHSRRSIQRRILHTFIPTKVFVSGPNSVAGTTESPIGFLIPGRGARGIPLKDILEGDATDRMAWGDQFFFSDVLYGEIELRLLWPGYEGYEGHQRIDLYENGERMCLTKLARKVSEFIFGYMQHCEHLQPQDGYAKWRVSREHLWMRDITIVSLVNTMGNIWQPELAIEKQV